MRTDRLSVMDELALELPADEQALRAMLQAQARRYEALLAEREAQLERSEQTIEQLRGNQWDGLLPTRLFGVDAPEWDCEQPIRGMRRSPK